MTKQMHTSARILIVVAALSAAAVYAQTDAQKAFNAIKNMPGTWEGKSPDGRAFQVLYKVTAGGSAVQSEILVPNEDMISMFHLDGPNSLLLTHYCAMGIQPRMQASLSELAELDRLKSDFIAITSHELRTPLGVILGHATYLRDVIAPEQRAQIDSGKHHLISPHGCWV